MNDELLSLHLAIITRRWPKIAIALTAANPSELEVALCEGAGSTLLVNGIQLTSRHDREAEAMLQAASLPDHPTLHVYGTGLGDLQRALLSRSRLRQLQVHILNRHLFVLVLTVLEQQDWLDDPRVTLTLAADESEIDLPFFALPAELQLVEEQAVAIRGRLVSENLARYTRQRFDPDSPAVRDRLADNHRRIEQDGDVAALFGSYPGAAALVVASGPSLQWSLPALKVYLERFPHTLLLCVDTALAFLKRAGIMPTLVVSIDDAMTSQRLSVEGVAPLPLVYFPLVPGPVLDSWPGPRLTAYSSSPMFAALRQQLPKGTLHHGGSVLHPTVDLAVKMGAREVILLGCDFAFIEGQTHSGWQSGELGPAANQALSWTLDGQGRRVATNPNFTTYQIELERYIQAHPEVQFWNTSRRGAAVQGCAYHPEFCV